MITMNAAMAALGPPSVDADGKPELDERLEQILAEGFQTFGDCVVLARFEDSLAHTTLESHQDATALETFINHCHLEDVLGLSPDDPTVIAQAGRYAGRLAAELERTYPGDRFTVIFTVSDSCIVRFHKQRTGESWLVDDLESYGDKAVLTMSVPA